MGQDFLYDFLAERPDEWFSVMEIKVFTGVSKNAVSEGLRRMRRSNTVFFKKDWRPATTGVKMGRREMLVYKYKRCH